MQTLQSARVTSKPQLTLPINSSYASSSNGYDGAPRAPLRATGILRHRPAHQPIEENHHLDSDPKTVELLTRFLVSNGIPLETSKDASFLDLVKHLNSECVIPNVNVMSKFLEKSHMNPKPLVNYQKTVGPLTVTVDTQTDQYNQCFLVFSIHYFEDLYERKNIVYLRKLHVGEINAEVLLITVRRAVNSFTYQNVKFSNIVLPNENLFQVIRNSGIVKRTFVCFYNYMSNFVHELLTIPEFSNGLSELRTFVKYIKKDQDQYKKFRIMQFQKSAELNVPKMDRESSWESTAIFLTKCLVLHDTFVDHCERFQLGAHISNTTFTHLVFFQRILQQCIKHCRNLSQPDNSMSQVIPAVNSLKAYISEVNMGYRFQNSIVEMVNKNFRNVVNGVSRHFYEVSTFLDPRYGHRELEKSQELEHKVMSDFENAEPGLERAFYSDISLMTKAERRTTIQKELMFYRQVIHVQRPEEAESPFIWWGRRQTDMEFLATMAREYLATPATSISAPAYFSDSGKFHYLCEAYSCSQLEHCLSTAGIHQKYVGRGWSQETITPEMQEALNGTEKRILKTVNFEMYAPGCSSAQEREEILGAAYPPLPTYANREMMEEPRGPQSQHHEELEEPKEEAGPPHRRPGGPRCPPPQPIRQVIQVRPAAVGGQPRMIPAQVKMVQHRNIVKTPLYRRPMVHQHHEEKPPELIAEPEIKEEELDDEEDAPPPRLARPAPIIRQVVIAKPQTAQMPQNIKPHSFTQKFAGQQRFYKKAPLPPPISIRAPMPNRVHNHQHHQEQQKEMKPETFEEEEEEAAGGDDGGDDYEDFEKHLEQPQSTDRFAPNFRPVFDPIRAVQMSRVAGMSAERCYEAHRNNQEALRRVPCNRRCNVCGHLTKHEALKNVTIDNEKLLLMVGCVYRGEFSLSAAREFLHRQSKTYVCHVHFEETLDEIYSMLHLSSPDEIECCPADLLQNTLITVTQLNPHITGQQLRKVLYDFAARNNHLREFRTNLMESYDTFPPPLPQPHQDLDPEDEEIIPKSHRQPRKQVLEKDTDSGTIKVIAQENFKLPEAKPSDNDEDCDNPAVCCFCSRVGSRQGMHKIPRSEDRLARWIEKLGPEFEQRLNAKEENLICRSHFPDEAFSSRGRLLKGMIPEAEPEKYEVTYQIKGDTFKKVDEQRSGPSCPRIGVPVERVSTCAKRPGRPKGSTKKAMAKKKGKAARESSTETSQDGSEGGYLYEDRDRAFYDAFGDVKQEIPYEEEEGFQYAKGTQKRVVKEEEEEEEDEEEEEVYDEDFDYDPDQPSTSSALQIARRAVKRHAASEVDGSVVRKSRRQAARRVASSMSASDDEGVEDPYASRAKIASNFLKQRHGKQ